MFEHERALKGPKTPGWAASHTAAIDGFFRPALALCDLALGQALPPEAEVLPASVGRPLYLPLRNYALVRAGVRVRPLPVPVTGDPAINAFVALTAVALDQPTDHFDRMVAGQRATGEFLDASPYDSPDLHWYDELVMLHALASYQAMRPSEWAARAIERSAEFHLAETQPDHCTTQPWALHAFGRRQETVPLAELLLHGAMAQNAGRLDVVSRVLLADAVLGLGGR